MQQLDTYGRIRLHCETSRFSEDFKGSKPEDLNLFITPSSAIHSGAFLVIQDDGKEFRSLGNLRNMTRRHSNIFFQTLKKIISDISQRLVGHESDLIPVELEKINFRQSGRTHLTLLLTKEVLETGKFENLSNHKKSDINT